MANPGEVNQEIGRAYQKVFIAALEANIREFENLFDVHSEPEKMSFKGRGGSAFSFDFGGIYRHPIGTSEVLGECKGYYKAGDLLAQFKTFLAKVYVVSTDSSRHQNDRFWFVTNVPFACSVGSGTRSVEFIRAALSDDRNTEVKEILGSGQLDEQFLHRLTTNVGVFILTDSYLMSTELSYKVQRGDNLWNILKQLHGGRRPGQWPRMKQQIAERNNLESPDYIRAGARIRLPWYGMGSNSQDMPSF